MANRSISMNKIKQIIRLYCGGIGSKKSNQITGVSRNVVKTYVRAFRSLGLTLEQVEALDDFALYALFHPQSEESRLPDIARYERLQKLLPQIARARHSNVRSDALFSGGVTIHGDDPPH